MMQQFNCVKVLMWLLLLSHSHTILLQDHVQVLELLLDAVPQIMLCIALPEPAGVTTYALHWMTVAQMFLAQWTAIPQVSAIWICHLGEVARNFDLMGHVLLLFPIKALLLIYLKSWMEATLLVTSSWDDIYSRLGCIALLMVTCFMIKL